MPDWKRFNPLTLTLSQRERGSFPRQSLPLNLLVREGLFPRSSLLPSPLAGEGLGMRGGLLMVSGLAAAGTVQDARAWPSTGFRPPFGLGRVTFLCVAKEKSPKERPPPPSRPPSAGFLASLFGSGGAPQMVHPIPTAAAPSSLTALLTHRVRLGGLEGDQDKPVPALSSRLTANKLPLPPGEGRG